MTEQPNTETSNNEIIRVLETEREEWFKKRIDWLKEQRTRLKTHAEIKERTDDNTPISVRSAASELAMLYSGLIEIYEMFEDLEGKFGYMESEFQSHRPTWDYMKSAMEHTQDTIKKGK
jgi:hypothetical protein